VEESMVWRGDQRISTTAVEMVLMVGIDQLVDEFSSCGFCLLCDAFEGYTVSCPMNKLKENDGPLCFHEDMKDKFFFQ
jgi:hypothetical protein